MENNEADIGPSWVSRAQSIAILLLLLTSLWAPSASDGGLLDYLRYAMFGLLGTAIIGLASIEANWREPLLLPASTGLLLLFVIYVALSAFWSEAWPASGIKAGLVLLGVLATLAAATSKSNEELVKLVVLAAAIFTFIGCGTALLIPSVGVETGWLLEGKWRGLSGQKNGYAMLASVSLVGVAVLMWGKQKPSGGRAFLWPSLLIAFFGFCLAMAGSRGGQLMCAIGLSSAWLVQLDRSWRTLLVVGGLLLAAPLLVAALMSAHADGTQLGFLGLTFDTSSRTMIWSYGLEQLAGRELIGYGLAGFWTPDRMTIFKDNNGWVLDNFHNGYVTILVENGLFGLTLLLAALGCIGRQLWMRTPSPSRSLLFSACYFAMFLAENLVENVIGRSTDFLLLTFLLITFSALRLPPNASTRPSANASPAPLTTW